STPTNNNQRISSNPRNRQIAQPGINMGQHRKIQMVGGNGGNQFRQYTGQNAGNPTGYNDVIGNQIGNDNLVAARDEGNAAGKNGNQTRCYNCRGVGHYARNCTVRPRRRDAAYLQTQLLIAQKEEAGIQLQAEEYDLMAAAAHLDEIKEVNANCILIANLLQASFSDTQTDSAPVYDTDGSAEYMQIVMIMRYLICLLKRSSILSYSNPFLNHARLQNFEIQFLMEAAKFVGDFKSLANEADASLAKHKALELEIERLLKAVLFKKVSDQKDKTQDTSKNTEFAKQPIVENLPKIGKTNALSKPVTSNSVSTPQESKSVNNDKVIAS
nr:hypothetical protein [Tanacetum cinerariifolium]